MIKVYNCKKVWLARQLPTSSNKIYGTPTPTIRPKTPWCKPKRLAQLTRSLRHLKSVGIVTAALLSLGTGPIGIKELQIPMISDILWWKQVKSWPTSSLRCQWTNDVDYIDVDENEDDDDDDDDGPFRRCFLYNYDCKEKKKHRHTHRQDARPHRLDRTGAAPHPVPGNLWLLSQKVFWCLKYPPTKKTVISNSHPKSPPIFNPSHETNSGYLFGVATQAQTSGRDLAIWWVDWWIYGGYQPQWPTFFVDRLVSFHNFSSHPTKSTEANGYPSRTNSGTHPYIQVPHNNGRFLAHKHTRRIYMIIQNRPANICDVII